MSLRVFADVIESRTYRYRGEGGRQEVDFIIERLDGKVIAIESKFSSVIHDHDVRHLNWLESNLGTSLLDRIVITTGTRAYRRHDGIAVVPLALLGP